MNQIQFVNAKPTQISLSPSCTLESNERSRTVCDCLPFSVLLISASGKVVSATGVLLSPDPPDGDLPKQLQNLCLKRALQQKTSTCMITITNTQNKKTEMEVPHTTALSAE